ncbi:hypothetical protein DU478_19005 [Thalassococcus profundi]|uniref:Uncharacterized protein n=1 Tax=Thalassococcus profundi TaxID=2282382 RepID=A0A369TJT8_9RHOB|nr:hypothetical protein DU478_19005 [Thalassococcus profundi]
MRRELDVSERRACRTLGQHRSTQRKMPQGRADEKHLTDGIIELADQYLLTRHAARQRHTHCFGTEFLGRS